LCGLGGKCGAPCSVAAGLNKNHRLFTGVYDRRFT